MSQYPVYTFFNVTNIIYKGLDVHKDTPTEILHTILLGVVKYFWGQTVYVLIQSKKFDVLQARLESVSTDGLNIPRIMAAYMCQYRGALIGKHFKTLVQIMPFVVDGLVDRNLLDAWVLLGRLAVLCWFTKILNLDDYLVCYLLLCLAISTSFNDFSE